MGEQEKEIDADGSSRMMIDINLRWARLYLATGYIKEVLDGFVDVLYQALQDGEDKLYTSIQGEMDEVFRVL